MMTNNTATVAGPKADRFVFAGLLVAGAVTAAVLTVLALTLLARPLSANVVGPTQEFPVSTTSSNQLAPAIDKDLVVWEDERDGLINVYGKKLPNGEEFVVSSGPSAKKKPVTNGKFVVWEDHRDGNADIRGYDLSTKTEFSIASGPAEQRKPAISGGSVVWEDKRDGTWEIYRYDLGSGQTVRVTGGDGDKLSPAISGETVVWRKQTTPGRSDIYARNLATGEEFAVSTGEAYKDMPAVSGSLIVWRQESVANYDIFGRDLYAKDLATGEVFQVTTDPSDQVAPAISGTVVVWEDHRDGNANIYGKDLATGDEFQVAAGTTPQETPQISGETVVWESQRVGDTNFGTYDVYGATLDVAPARPGDLGATGSTGGVALSWKANTEGDLAGYNVYRKDPETGSYARLNQELLPGVTTSYEDAEAPKGETSHYRVTAVDAAGNEGAPATVRAAARAQTGVNFTAAPAVLKYGGRAVLSGKLTVGGRPLPGKQVVLEQKPAGAKRFAPVPGGTLSTVEDGGFQRQVKPRKNTHYRARFAGEPDAGLLPSTSTPGRVMVKPKVSIGGPKPTRGGQLSIGGQVTRVKAGRVVLLVERRGKVVARKSARLHDSRYRFAFKPRKGGSYTAKAVFPSTRAHLGNSSLPKKLRGSR